jgi:osmotically-inducible protein OsmY
MEKPMKTKLLILATFSSVAMLSADQWDNQQMSAYQNQNSSFKQTPRTIMDDEIAKSVRSVMAGNWLSAGYPNVTFDVNNGTVSLRGMVDTREDRAKIEQAVKKIEGVKGVRNDITVGMQPAHDQKSKMLSMNSNNQNRANGALTGTMTKDSAATDSDRTINSKLREKISRLNPKGYETLVFTTTNGVVVITGNIERVEDIQKISNEARNVEGVKNVTNKVTASKRY